MSQGDILGVKSASTIDLIVQVTDAPNNGNPPAATYINDPYNFPQGITGFTEPSPPYYIYILTTTSVPTY